MLDKERTLFLIEVFVFAIILLCPFSPVTAIIATTLQMVFWVLLIKWQN